MKRFGSGTMQESDTLDSYFAGLQDRNVRFLDEHEFRCWLFEYGCQATEFLECDPKNVPGLVKFHMLDMMKDVYKQFIHCKDAYIPTPPLEYIPDVVRAQFMTGKQDFTRYLR